MSEDSPAQVTHGLRGVLSHPAVYSAFQNLLGANRSRRLISAQHLRAHAGDVVVDVGCGPAEILDLLPEVQYHGFDMSPSYIEAARARHADRGAFHPVDVQSLAADAIPPCQLAIAIGLLHHLDDADAVALIDSLYARLAPGGRLVTVDPAYWPGQSRIGRYLITRDRGQQVREGEAYRALVRAPFAQVELLRRDDLLRIPYSHAVLECTK
jgi:SAM-dependent methyltransferase